MCSKHQRNSAVNARRGRAKFGVRDTGGMKGLGGNELEDCEERKGREEGEKERKEGKVLRVIKQRNRKASCRHGDLVS